MTNGEDTAGPSDFGIIITCCPSDLWMAKGCCASVRHFMPNIPICLLFDGETEQVAQIANTYAALVVHRGNVKSSVLRERSFGYGLTKMIAFWESPFKRFLQIDADTIVVGDMRVKADFSDAEFIIDSPMTVHSSGEIAQLFFDPDKISKLDPEFNWQGRRYVCPGVLFATRGIFSLDHYEKLLEIAADDPSFFKFGDMGMVNYLLFCGADRELFRLKHEPIQVLPAMHSHDEIEQLYRVPNYSSRERIVYDGLPIVLHYASMRPFSFVKDVYTEPMTYFRQKYRKDCLGSLNVRDLPVRIEEILLRRPRLRAMMKRITPRFVA